jgi:CIC family chloride channel protein
LNRLKNFFKKYSRFRLYATEPFFSYIRKWIFLSVFLGLVTGLVVAAIHIVIYEILWDRLYGICLSFKPLVIIIPAMGLLLAGFVLRLAKDPLIQGTEEVINAFHEHGGEMDISSTPAKLAASILTIGFGGSAGMEGPSIYAGGSIGPWLWKKLKFKIFREDLKIMTLAGGAAGISAIFKAPLTGIVFALEVPYKDDLAHEAIVPSLIASVASYVTFVSIVGPQPLFRFTSVSTFALSDLLFSALLGIISGLLAIVFSTIFHRVSEIFRRTSLLLPFKTFLGGLSCGIIGAVAVILCGAPLSLGSGYVAIKAILAEALSPLALFSLLILKMAATIFTLSSGGAGGIFIPITVMGASLGAFFGEAFVGKNVDLYGAIGMASLLSACYKTPLAAVTFVAETTGSPNYLIPSIIAATISYIVSGDISISSSQKVREEIALTEISKIEVGEVMIKNVITVPAETDLQSFVDDFIFKYRHVSFPVCERSEFVGVVSLDDIVKVPKEKWVSTKVIEVCKRDAIIAYPNESLGEVMDKMYLYNIGRIPVVDPSNSKKLIGIIAKTDIIRISEMKRVIH